MLQQIDEGARFTREYGVCIEASPRPTTISVWQNYRCDQLLSKESKPRSTRPGPGVPAESALRLLAPAGLANPRGFFVRHTVNHAAR